jgi:hypothetical protein
MAGQSASKQSDPWAEAAQAYNASGQSGAAPAENDDWKVWQQSGSSSSPTPTPLTGIVPHQSDTLPHALTDVFSNIGGGGLGALEQLGRLTPFGIAADAMDKKPTIYEDIYNAGRHPFQTGKRAISAFAEHPLENIEGAIGAAGATGGVAETPEAFSPYRSPVIAPAEEASERLARAILPPEGVTPNLVKAIQREAPAVREYAGRTGNPLKTIPEGMKAAQGVADEGLQHYRSAFLEPNAGNRVILGEGISPELGHSATLGQIEKRISDINDLTRGAATRAKSAGAEMTAQERLGLENEGKALRQNLYRSLSEKTGVSPEDIQGMREGYGGQYAFKNALEGGHYNRLTRVGLESQGAGTGIYPSKAGLVEKLMTTLRGGPERIANRQFSSGMRLFDPEAPSRPTPFVNAPPDVQPALNMPPVDLNRVRAWTSEPPPRVIATTPLNGPMAKAPAVQESERLAKSFQDEQNAAFHARRAANRATAGKRLNPDVFVKEQ